MRPMLSGGRPGGSQTRSDDRERPRFRRIDTLGRVDRVYRIGRLDWFANVGGVDPQCWISRVTALDCISWVHSERRIRRVHLEHRIHGFDLVGGCASVDVGCGRPSDARPRSCHDRGGAHCDGHRASADAAAQVMIFGRSVVGDNRAHMVHDGVNVHVDALAGTTVFHLDKTIIDPAPSNNDRGYSNQLSIFETNPG